SVYKQIAHAGALAFHWSAASNRAVSHVTQRADPTGRYRERNAKGRAFMGASRASIGLAFVAAMACTGVARAQVGDEIANGGFDTNLDGWEVVAIGASTASWNALGADGSPASGSLRTEMVYEGSLNNVRVYQCVTATAGEPYSFGAWIRRQAGGGGGHGWVRVFWYESSDCSGPEIDISDASGALPDDTWVLIQLLDEP